MNAVLRTSLLAACCIFTLPALADEKTDFALLHALSSVPANRIVGLWNAQVQLSPCSGGPSFQIRSINAFNLGGTLVDTAAGPPTSRGPGFGAWIYNHRDRTYSARMHFFRYMPDGSFDGTSDVRREISLSDDGMQASEAIVARNLNPDGTLRVELCGTATGTRVPID